MKIVVIEMLAEDADMVNLLSRQLGYRLSWVFKEIKRQKYFAVDIYLDLK